MIQFNSIPANWYERDIKGKPFIKNFNYLWFHLEILENNRIGHM